MKALTSLNTLGLVEGAAWESTLPKVPRMCYITGEGLHP